MIYRCIKTFFNSSIDKYIKKGTIWFTVDDTNYLYNNHSSLKFIYTNDLLYKYFEEVVSQPPFNYAEYKYFKRTNSGVEVLTYRSRYISTIDIPYGRYELKYGDINKF